MTVVDTTNALTGGTHRHPHNPLQLPPSQSPVIAALTIPCYCRPRYCQRSSSWSLTVIGALHPLVACAAFAPLHLEFEEKNG